MQAAERQMKRTVGKISSAWLGSRRRPRSVREIIKKPVADFASHSDALAVYVAGKKKKKKRKERKKKKKKRGRCTETPA
ncbi:hypothetical protein PUN28_003414 [Cardiocondyla obscurior]|uniref:Uncharacterized protein n=1 Tax=Cardiocondyla obscurior TaxID=286306 RepID=A0AAW2GLQ1_9HYME